jgi:multiple sugar transport system permease protein
MKKTVLEQEALIGWVLILPALTLITGLSLYPLLYNLYLSFFHASLSEKNSFIGLNNYKYILLDPVFWRSLGVTLLYTTGTTLGTTLMGIGTALLLNKPFPGRRLVRALVILPYAAPLISEVFSWQFLFDPVNGIFIDILVEKTGILSTRFNLLAEAPVFFIILFSIWRNFPFTALLILSRLQVIDRNLYDAAGVDGASWWQ